MDINLQNKGDIGLYIADNIELINSGINKFKKKHCPDAEYDETDIKNFLKAKLHEEFPRNEDQIFEIFSDLGFKKNKIGEVANHFGYYKSHLETYIIDSLFKKLLNEFELDSRSNTRHIVTLLFEKLNVSSSEQAFIKTKLENILKKSMYISLSNGFATNINNIESGVMTANAGDSAQFLFVSRAILAGYNCSNVDVRSSRYDAIIDYKGKLFKVQVKGISDSTVSFKDRDRGGRGIDTSNERNIGKIIRASDCDIYVAVDKQVGLCYIVPMREIDEWDDSDKISVPVTLLEKYKENWEIIDNLYEYQ